jgi:hypothetical protein
MTSEYKYSKEGVDYAIVPFSQFGPAFPAILDYQSKVISHKSGVILQRCS